MTQRRHRLANRRAHDIVAIEHEGQRYKVGLGRELICIEREQLGPIVEVFLNAQKVNSQADVLASDGAILMSMLLQYGCPPADIFHAMKRNPDGSLSSPLGRAAAFLVEPDSVSALDPATGAETAAAPGLTDPPVAAAGLSREGDR